MACKPKQIRKGQTLLSQCASNKAFKEKRFLLIFVFQNILFFPQQKKIMITMKNSTVYVEA
jgi:hypothetical protein